MDFLNNTQDYVKFRDKVFKYIRYFISQRLSQNLQEFTIFINDVLDHLKDEDQIKLIGPIKAFICSLTDPHELLLVFMRLCLKYSNYKQARIFIENNQFILRSKPDENLKELYIVYYYCCGIVYSAYWDYSNAIRYFQYVIKIQESHKYNEDMNKWKLIKQLQIDERGKSQQLKELLEEQNSKDQQTKDEIQDFCQLIEETMKHIQLCQHRLAQGQLMMGDNCDNFDLCRRDCMVWDLGEIFMLQREYLKKLSIKTLTGGILDIKMLEFINGKLKLFKIHEQGQYLEFEKLEPSMGQIMDQLLSYKSQLQSMIK